MSGFVLPLFPDGSLASSVITTVWVGVFVVCLFNLRFGWVLSGLVVPGYVVPLLIAKPLSAVTVLIEASLTYAIFWLLSERLAGPSRWSSFFGRDRFMGLILVSVAVRLLLDGWLLPLAADALAENSGLTLDWKHNLHSFGLIVIALLANQLWKPGYVRGMAQVLVMIGLTFLIVRYGLMELTNFRIGAVVYLYEDFASSILASPKAYIILITTCFIASRMNLRYGWDFSGILIPALLALQWYQPWKILTSIAEALVIYFLATAVLGSRLFASATVEGARKVLLFFNISFAYKLLLGHGLSVAGIEQRITDFYGFGYLLPTLIALKAHDKGILTRVTRATVQISLTGAVVGSLIGFMLMLLLPGRHGSATASIAAGLMPAPTAAGIVAAAAGAAHIDEARADFPAIAALTAPSFRAALQMIDGGRSDAEVRALLREAGFRLQPLAGGRLAVLPTGERGLALLFDPGARRRLAITVARPVDRRGIALAALALFEQQDARWLIVGGAAAPGSDARPGSTAVEAFAQALNLPTVALAGGERTRLALAGNAVALDLAGLQSLLGQTDVSFGFARRPSESLLTISDAAVARSVERAAPARQRRDPRVPYSRAELAFIRLHLLDPLLAGTISPATAHGVATAVGLELRTMSGADRRLLVELRQTGSQANRYLLRPRASGPILQLAAGDELDAPAARLFEQMDGRALLIAADPDTDPLTALISQAVLAQAARPAVTLQLRARPQSVGMRGEVLIAPDRIEVGGGFGEQLTRRLRQSGWDARPIARDAMSAGLESGPSPQLRFVRQALGGRTAVLWLAPMPGVTR